MPIRKRSKPVRKPQSRYGAWFKALRTASRGLTQAQIGAWVEKTDSTVSQWERGLTLPELDNFLQVIDHLAEHARETDNEELIAVLSQELPVLTGAPQGRTVPLISSVAAGRWQAAEDPYPVGTGDKLIPVEENINPNAFALRIDGESMTPRFVTGDIVIIDPDVEAQPGEFVVAKSSSESKEATFKRIVFRIGKDGRQEAELEPLNGAWPTLPVVYGEGRIVGVMVEHRSFRRR